jgi:hypothetical protein
MYTIIFMVVVATLFLLCLIAYFIRKRRVQQDGQNASPPMFDRTRNFLFRNLLLNDGTPEWMCIICGFDNKPRNAHCIMCGTAHEFSKDYKTKKFETKRLKKELRAARTAAEARAAEPSSVDIQIPHDAQMTSVSTSLRYFLSAPETSTALSPDKRREALNYRRLNQLTLRQKSARRRRMWQRRVNPATGELVWVRVPIHKTKVGSAPFGYTPRHSFAEHQNSSDDSFRTSFGTTNTKTGSTIAQTLASIIGASRGLSNPQDQSHSSRRGSFSGSHSSVQSNLPLYDPVADLMAAASSPIQNPIRKGGAQSPRSESRGAYAVSKRSTAVSPMGHRRRKSRDSFDDSVLASHSPGYTSVFDDEGELVWEKVESGKSMPPKAKRGTRNTSTGEAKEGPLVIRYVSNSRGPYQQNNYFPRQQRLYTQPSFRTMATIQSADQSPAGTPPSRGLHGEPDGAGSIAGNLLGLFSRVGGSRSNSRSESSEPLMRPVAQFPVMDEETGDATRLREPLLPAPQESSSVLQPSPTRTVHSMHSIAVGPSAEASAGPSSSGSPFSPFSMRSPSPMDYAGEDVDLSTIASMTYRTKLLWFLDRLAEFQVSPTEGYIKIEIRRTRLLEDSHSVMMQFQPEDLHKFMRIEFHGEPGVDAGGLEREWFALVTEEFFKPEYGLFTCAGSETLGAYHINPTSGAYHAQHLSYYRFIGRFVGKAILGQHSINANFSLPLRKQMLTMPVTFSDLEFVDEELYRNLVWLKTNTDVSSLMLYFSISYPGVAGQAPVEYELKPGGADILVTDENKEEYLQLRLRHRLLDSIKPQLEQLLIGLYEVIPADLLSVFDYQELDLLLCGVPDIDVADWKENTEYLWLYRKQGANHKVIKWFWTAVEAMSHEERIRLLQYVTGCARLPSQGFKALQSTDGRYRKFNIQSIYKKVRTKCDCECTVRFLVMGDCSRGLNIPGLRCA